MTAVLNVFQSVDNTFTLFTDSLYVAESVPLLELVAHLILIN